ncbi:hypothetical protein OWV82_015715 [Melia azedarach]|uniref:Uncharacterized protein n=1 Tax=Melia azedarach TaxID=155640 RepID=A0ACC1XQP9_MELAZ|nr:hypothetical protein OWV82_015715 [Melia azedarach]
MGKQYLANVQVQEVAVLNSIWQHDQGYVYLLSYCTEDDELEVCLLEIKLSASCDFVVVQKGYKRLLANNHHNRVLPQLTADVNCSGSGIGSFLSRTFCLHSPLRSLHLLKLTFFLHQWLKYHDSGKEKDCLCSLNITILVKKRIALPQVDKVHALPCSIMLGDIFQKRINGTLDIDLGFGWDVSPINFF